MIRVIAAAIGLAAAGLAGAACGGHAASSAAPAAGTSWYTDSEGEAVIAFTGPHASVNVSLASPFDHYWLSQENSRPYTGSYTPVCTVYFGNNEWRVWDLTPQSGGIGTGAQDWCNFLVGEPHVTGESGPATTDGG
jgi:hypothetical protein